MPKDKSFHSAQSLQFQAQLNQDAIEVLKGAHAEATAGLRSSLETAQAAAEDLRNKLDSARADASAAAATIKAKDDLIGSLRASIDQVCKAAGKESVEQAMGVFAAWKQEVEANVELRAKVSKIEADQKASALKALIDKGVLEGKITPAEAELYKDQSASFVETLLKVRPAIVNTSGKPTDPPKPAETLAPVSVSAEVQDLVRQLGHDPAKLQAQISAGQTPAVA